MFKSWQSITLWKRVLIGLAIGVTVGLGLREGLGEPAAIEFGNTWIQPWGQAFVRLIKMLIVPLIVTTLVSGVTAMGDPKRLGSLGLRTISLYLVTTFFAVSLGLAIGTVLKPGVGVKYDGLCRSNAGDHS